MTPYLDHVYFINNLSQGLWLSTKWKKKKIKIQIINNFFYSKNQTKKSSEQKDWIKNLYWPITVKMTITTQFSKNDSLTPHGYKKTLRAHLKSNWSQIFTRFNKEIEVFSTSSFVAISLSLYWWRYQIHQTKCTFNHKLVGSWMCAKHQLLGVCAGDQLLVLLHCLKAGLNGR